VLPLAGNVITNDIRESCKILKHQAESLKTKFGSCVPNLVNQDDIIAIPGIRNQPPREISVKTLAGIIKARMQLILEQVQYEIQLSGYERQLIAGVVLTGGGARLKNIKEFAEVTIGIDSRIGTPDEHLDQQGSITFEDLGHPMYATGIGLVIYGLLETERQQRDAAEEKSDAEDAPAVGPTPAPGVDDTEEEVVESPKAKKKKEKKIEEGKKGKNFADSVKNWLTDKFTEPDLGE
jgi:cell division protein FtsA